MTKKKKLRLEVEAFGAAGRIRTAHITPRNQGFAGTPDLGFDVLRTDEVGGAQTSASRKGRYGERNPSGVSFTSNETGVSRRFPQENVSSK